MTAPNRITQRTATGALLGNLVVLGMLGMLGACTIKSHYSGVHGIHNLGADEQWNPSVKLKRPYDRLNGNILYLTIGKYKVNRTQSASAVKLFLKSGDGQDSSSTEVVDAWLIRVDLANNLVATTFRSVDELVRAHPGETPPETNTKQAEFFALGRHYRGGSPTSTTGRFAVALRAPASGPGTSAPGESEDSERPAGARQLDVIDTTSDRVAATFEVDNGFRFLEPEAAGDNYLIVGAQAESGKPLDNRVYILDLASGTARYLDKLVGWELLDGADVIQYDQGQGPVWEHLTGERRLKEPADRGMRVGNRFYGYKGHSFVIINLDTLSLEEVTLSWVPQRMYADESSGYVVFLGNVRDAADRGMTAFDLCSYQIAGRSLRCTTLSYPNEASK